MKIKEVVDVITDLKVYIEIIEDGSGASFGFYDINYIPETFAEKEVKNINVQYTNGKRCLIIKF